MNAIIAAGAAKKAAGTAKDTAKTAGKWIAKNKKPILIAVAVVVSAWITWIIIKKLRIYYRTSVSKNDAETLTGQSITPGLQFDELLAQIALACKGFRSWNTNEEAIYGALAQLKNQADWEYIQSLWSDRVYSNLNGLQSAMAWGIWGISQSLVGTLMNELSSSELQHCRDVLKSNGIDPGF